MKVKNLLLLFVVTCIFIAGCQEDQVIEEINEMEEIDLCPSQYNSDTIFLTQETLGLFPYKSNYFLDSIFYESESGDRVFARKRFTSPRISYGGRWPNVVPCVHDSTDEVQVNLANEIIGFGLYVDDLELYFSIGYRVWQDMNRYEENYFYEIGSLTVLSQTEDPYFITPIPQITLVLQDLNWPRNLPNPLEPVDELVLDGKVYASVFINTTGNDKFEIYFNYQKGIVAFKDTRDGILYTLVE